MSVGIWTFAFEGAPISAVREAVAEIEQLGFDGVWFGEYAGREAFTQAALLLAATSELTVGTGIAKFDRRGAIATEAAARTLGEAYPGRFVLGLGGHLPGHSPIAAMTAYLSEMDSTELVPAQPSPRPKRLIAALGPKMLDLAREHTDGVHPYLVPPEHTALARERLGKDAYIAVEQSVVLGEDRAAARELAREHVGMYVRLAAHHRANLTRLGFTGDDLAQLSNRLLDALVVHGEQGISDRIRAHLDAGADQVCLQVRRAGPGLPLDEWRALAAVKAG